MPQSTVRERRRPISFVLLPALVAVALALAATDAGAAPDIGRWVVAGGGANSAGGNFSLAGTAGQLAAGPLAAGSYKLGAGFWGVFGGGVLAVGGEGPGGADAPAYELRIFPVTPNPARSLAQIAYEIPAPRRVGVRIFDINGRLVRDLTGDGTEPGHHVLTWDTRGGSGQPVRAGVYFVRINLGDLVRTQRLVVIP